MPDVTSPLSSIELDADELSPLCVNAAGFKF
jgi:hypothetical protein